MKKLLLLIVLLMLAGCAREDGGLPTKYDILKETEQLQNEHAELFSLIYDTKAVCDRSLAVLSDEQEQSKTQTYHFNVPVDQLFSQILSERDECLRELYSEKYVSDNWIQLCLENENCQACSMQTQGDWKYCIANAIREW